MTERWRWRRAALGGEGVQALVPHEPAPRRLGLHLERREIAQEIAISWCEITHEIALPRAVAVLGGGDALPGGRVCARAECAVE